MQTQTRQPVAKAVLLILDGMGLNDDPTTSATTVANMPFVHGLMEQHGHARLQASGPEVGLDDGKAGNSEVGHLTIGAGRVLPSTLARIRAGYQDGTWEGSPAWDHCLDSRRLHVVGLLSDAGVHGHWGTLVQAAELGVKKSFQEVYLHVLLDGVDSQAGSSPRLLSELEHALAATNEGRIKLASVMGRKWATDRAANWDLTRHCRDALMGRTASSPFRAADLASHLEQRPSEADFPHAFLPDWAPIAANESVVLTNHRADRISQLAHILSEECHVMAMVELKQETRSIDDVFFPTQPLDGGLVDLLNGSGYRTVRLSEQCKFPHVTYFINGMKADEDATGIEVPTIPDDALVANPEMSIDALGRELGRVLSAGGQGQVLIVNVPNLDQIGHQGDILAAKQAASAVDQLVERTIVPGCREHGWELLITADHGNADLMVDGRGRPMGSHSTNEVPMIPISYTGKSVSWQRHSGSLANVAASLLTLLGSQYPATMDESLIKVGQ